MTASSAWTTTTILDATAKIMDYRGRTPKKLGMEWGDGHIPAISARNVRMGKIDFDEEFYVASDSLYRRWMTQGDMEQGDTLITTEAPLGNVAAVPDARRYVLSQRTVLLRPRLSLFDKAFFTQVLQSPEFQSLLTQNSSGSTALGIQRKKLEQLRIPTPPLKEQRRIANALRDSNDLIATLERLIAKKQAIKQGMMQQLLTGRTRLPGFDLAWRKKQLGELLAYEQPGRYLVSSTDYEDSGTPVLTAGKTFLLGYTAERVGVYDATPVIIFDDFTTASKFVDFPFKAKSSAMKMLSARPGACLRYVYERMQLIDFIAVDHKRRWIAEFSKLEVDVPDYDEQQAIARAIGDSEREVVALQDRLTKARALKEGMMQQLLTGRTRLPVEAAA